MIHQFWLRRVILKLFRFLQNRFLQENKRVFVFVGVFGLWAFVFDTTAPIYVSSFHYLHACALIINSENLSHDES